MLKPTGLNFKQGAPLKSSDLNIMNDTINQVVRVLNQALRERTNLTMELCLDKDLTLSEAIRRIPEDRITDGCLLRFKSPEGWVEYLLTGDYPERPGSWTLTHRPEGTIIDGGTIEDEG